MSLPTVTSTTQPKATATVTLDKVLQAMATWRLNKKTPSESIPDAIWDDIFALEKVHDSTLLRNALGISARQYANKVKQRTSHTAVSTTPEAQTAPFLCKVDTSAPSPLPEIAHNTVVVEFYRADGRLMKIHTTTDSFKQLMNDFYAE